MLAVLGGTYAVDLLDILLGWCSGLCLIWIHPSVSCWCFVCRVRSWMSAWVFLLLGGMESIVFGPIRWCVWSFRPSSPLRLPHLKFLFVCLYKNHAKDSTTEGYMQPDPTIMECGHHGNKQTNKNLRCGNRKGPWNVAESIPPKSRQRSYRDRAHDQEHHPLLHRLQWYGPEQGIKLFGLLLTGSTGQRMASRNGLA